VRGGEPIQLERQSAQLLEQLTVAEDLGRAVEVDVLVVVAGLGLRGRREDRLGQLGRLLEARGQRDPADRPALPVVLPAGSREVAAHDALDGEHLELLDEQAASARLAGDVGVGDEVVRADLRRARKPERRQAREHLALVGHR
jgi:hypothetical protein